MTTATPHPLKFRQNIKHTTLNAELTAFLNSPIEVDRSPMYRDRSNLLQGRRFFSYFFFVPEISGVKDKNQTIERVTLGTDCLSEKFKPFLSVLLGINQSKSFFTSIVKAFAEFWRREV